jgi:cell division protein FtsW (lipid II flippase)
MNFETKYLIRWGIPGWIMVMILFPYFVVTYFEFLSKHVSTSSDLLAVGAILTVLGVPLGYLLNQIHHSLFWVIPKLFLWNQYFKEELEIDKYISNHKFGVEKKERYRYLLSRKHELGGVLMSLLFSVVIIGLMNTWGDNGYKWSWIYFTVICVLAVFILFSRQYSSQNIQKYHDHFLNKKD